MPHSWALSGRDNVDTFCAQNVTTTCNAFPLIGNAARTASADPFGVLVGDIVIKVAQIQLDKINDIVRDDLYAMRLDASAPKTLNESIENLKAKKMVIDWWADSTHLLYHSDVPLQSPIFEGKTRYEVFDGSLKLYVKLAQTLLEIEKSIEIYQRTSAAAVLEKLGLKIGIWRDKKGPEADQPCARYNAEAYPYWLWQINEEEMTKIDNYESL